MERNLKPNTIRAAARMSLAGRWNTGAAAMLIFLLLLAGCVRLHALSQGLGYGVAALGMPVLLAGCQWLFLNVSSGAASSEWATCSPRSDCRAIISGS